MHTDIFSHFKLAHDINIMHELWGVPTYRQRNKFLTASSIPALIKALPDDDPDKAQFRARMGVLVDRYNVLANQYHNEKPESSTIVFD